MTATKTTRPWAQRANELEPVEGPYCEWAAWQEWLNAQENKQQNPGDMLADMDFDDQLNLYLIFCECFDNSPAPTVNA